LDYAWGFEQFKQNYRQTIYRQTQPPPIPKDETMGLLPFMEQRIQATWAQLDPEQPPQDTVTTL